MPENNDRLPSPPVVLASGSAYRRELLGRILPRFESVPPDLDETPRPGELPAGLAMRLARDKARHVAAARPDAVVIGSDQVAALPGPDGKEAPLGKPGKRERAIRQLLDSSGRTVTFYTAVCVVRPGEPGGNTHLDTTRVRFRPLTRAEIGAYLDREQPYDCAGSFRSEGLGIVLFNAIENQDPTALQGLPLIWLAAALTEAGVDLYAG